MGNKLIDEPPLLVLPSLAERIGLVPAVIVQQLHFLLENDSSVQEVDGQKWVRKTQAQLEQMFFFLGDRTIRRNLEKLRKDGIIEATDDLNSQSRDRTLWYTIHKDKLDISTPGQNDQMPPGQKGHLNKERIKEIRDKKKIRDKNKDLSYFSSTTKPLWAVLSRLETFPDASENIADFLESLVTDYPNIDHVEVCKDFVAWREDRLDLQGKAGLRTFFKNQSKDQKERKSSEYRGPGGQIEIT